MYSPKICTVTTYIFAFVWNQQEYKIHGLWPNSCAQCNSCGYPSCCIAPKSSIFNQSEFVDKYWLNGLDESKDSVCNQTTHYLYEHEAFKHGSCMNLSVNDYVLKTKAIFEKYQDQLPSLCNGQAECNLNLDDDLNLQIFFIIK